MTLTLGKEADASGRAVWEKFGPLLLDELKVGLEWEAKEIRKCGHVDPGDPRLLSWMSQRIAWTFMHVMHGSSDRAVDLRNNLRDGLVLLEAYDGAAARIHELAKAVRRREVYNVIRRAAALLEDLGETDPAALLAEYALQHEPVDDGAQFSRTRRRKSELRR